MNLVKYKFLRENPYYAHGSKKLKVDWSYESTQDLQGYYGINAEAELTSILTETITQSIDNEIINTLRNNVRNNLLPIVRRVQPQLLSNGIVDMQPMSTPTGYTWFGEFEYRKEVFKFLRGYCLV